MSIIVCGMLVFLISVSALLVSGQAVEGEECVLLFHFLISRPSCDCDRTESGCRMEDSLKQRQKDLPVFDLILLIYFTRISEFLYNTTMTECKHAHSGNANMCKETEHTQIHSLKKIFSW